MNHSAHRVARSHVEEGRPPAVALEGMRVDRHPNTQLLRSVRRLPYGFNCLGSHLLHGQFYLGAPIPQWLNLVRADRGVLREKADTPDLQSGPFKGCHALRKLVTGSPILADTVIPQMLQNSGFDFWCPELHPDTIGKKGRCKSGLLPIVCLGDSHTSDNQREGENWQGIRCIARGHRVECFSGERRLATGVSVELKRVMATRSE